MRNTLVDPFETVPRDVVVTANDFAAGSVFPVHAHLRGQFAFAASGMISVRTSGGRWLVPPGRACWIPTGVDHEMTMRGPVTMLNAFLLREVADVLGMPQTCGVFSVSPLLRQLFDEAVDLPPLYDLATREGKLMDLLVAEIAVMQPQSLHAPLPTDPRLMRICLQLFDEPSAVVGLDEIARTATMSRRTFTRRFRAEVGVSFADWRQQVCLLAAIERLGAGQSVTRVALDLGYASSSAFTAAFRRSLGQAPGRYMAVSVP